MNQNNLSLILFLKLLPMCVREAMIALLEYTNRFDRRSASIESLEISQQDLDPH